MLVLVHPCFRVQLQSSWTSCTNSIQHFGSCYCLIYRKHFISKFYLIKAVLFFLRHSPLCWTMSDIVCMASLIYLYQQWAICWLVSSLLENNDRHNLTSTAKTFNRNSIGTIQLSKQCWNSIGTIQLHLCHIFWSFWQISETSWGWAGLSWAKLSSSWGWTLLCFSKDLVSLDLVRVLVWPNGQKIMKT